MIKYEAIKNSRNLKEFLQEKEENIELAEIEKIKEDLEIYKDKIPKITEKQWENNPYECCYGQCNGRSEKPSKLNSLVHIKEPKGFIYLQCTKCNRIQCLTKG